MWKWNDLSSPLDPAFSSAALTVCANQQVNYTDQTTGAIPTSWFWQFPGGTPATSTVQNPTVTYAAAGIYGVTLTVSDGVSQTTVADTNYISVVAPAPAPSAITGPNSVCANTTNTFSVVNDPNVVYNWSFPATWSGSSTTNSIILTADATGGTVAVTAENVCGNSAASSIVVTAMPGSPTAAFSFSNNSGLVGFTSTSTDAANWSWDFGDGGSSNIENPSHTYNSNGTFNVTLIVSNGCGSDTLQQTVNVNGVGLSDLNNEKIHIYPVPAIDYLMVEVPEEYVNQSCVVLDNSGRVVKEFDINEKETKINLENFSNGLYSLQLGEILIGRFVIVNNN
jgi:PKD repeat protein